LPFDVAATLERAAATFSISNTEQKTSFIPDKKFLNALQNYFQAMKINFQTVKIYFQSLKIVLNAVSGFLYDVQKWFVRCSAIIYLKEINGDRQRLKWAANAK
jgi:hypothetical protein